MKKGKLTAEFETKFYRNRWIRLYNFVEQLVKDKYITPDKFEEFQQEQALNDVEIFKSAEYIEVQK